MMIAALAVAMLVTGEIDRESKILAAKSFAEGETAFAQKRFQAAGLAFERAGRLVPHPSTWLNASQAWERAADWVRTAENCDRVLELPDVGARFAVAAKKRLARVEPKLAHLEVDAPPEYKIRLDGGEVRRAPFMKRVLPGRHRLSWSDGDREHRRIVALSAGRRERIVLGPETPASIGEVESFAPAESATSTATSPLFVATSTESAAYSALLPLEIPPESEGLPPPPAASWVAFGASAVALGVGVVFGAMTLSAKSDFEAAPSLERADTFDDRRRTANVAFAVSAIAGSLGLGLWISDNLEL